MCDKIIISLILRSKIVDKNKLQKFRRLLYLRYKEYFDNTLDEKLAVFVKFKIMRSFGLTASG
jgi:hypothetical protein